MFFVHEMEERIPLHPSYFSSEAPDSIRELLYKKKEGTNTGTMMIVRIIGIQEISEPKVMPGTGMAMYTISYRAVVWQPFRGEVVDGEVSQVVPNGFFVDVGALGVFVSKAVSYDISLGLAEGFYRWNWTLTGVAMLSQMIPSSMKFSMEGATPSFEDNDGQVITAGGHVRLRIKGIRSELNQMFAIGSIREDYLGYELAPLSEQATPITDRDGFLVLFSTSRCPDIADTKNLLQLHGGSTATFFLFLFLLQRVYHNLNFSEALETWGARESEREKIHIKARKAMFTFFMSSNKIPNRNRNCSFSLRSHHLVPSGHQSIIIPLQPRLTSLPMPSKRPINPHNPPKKIPLLIQLLHKSPKPSQHKISITRLLTQNKGPTTIFP
jgi:DNA-directed RNA polymerase II subunit RPB7